jgi:hypothetical protein
LAGAPGVKYVPEPLAEWVMSVFKDTMDELRVPVADKVKQPATVFEAIGGQYCLEAGNEGVGPTTSACLKLKPNNRQRYSRQSGGSTAWKLETKASVPQLVHV